MSRIRSCALAIAVLLLGLPVAAAADTFSGTLSIVWGDPKDRAVGAGGVFYTLATPDGRYLSLEVPGGVDAALPFNRQQVIVTGQVAAPRAGAAVGGGAGDTVVVESFALDPSASPAERAGHDDGPKVTGTKKVLFLLLRFADDSSDPHASTFFDALTNPDLGNAGLGIPASINGFYKKTSNNLFSWVGDVGGSGGVSAPGGPARAWLVLPQPKSFYAPCGFSSVCFTGANFNNFNSHAASAAAAAGIDLTPYDNINFVISNDLDCCAWGGSVTIAAKTYGATWEPAWSQETRVYSHEMGHSLGLPHSGWVYSSYDSPWDVMSDYSDNVITPCGTYFSRNDSATETIYCREPGNGFIMAHRDVLGWIPAPNQVSVPVGSGNSVTLEGGSLPVTSAVKMIKICLPGLPCTGTGSTTRYFTVEARVKDATTTTLFDHGIPNEGIIIHDVWFGRPAISGACFFNNQSGYAVPIDATPGDFTGSPSCSGAGLTNAQFTAGMTYTNATYGFKVIVGARTGNTWNITVQNNMVISAGDFDGDAKADMTLYQPDGTWRILKSTSSYTASTVVGWGGAGYVPVPGDYDGDGRLDPAIYNSSTGQWLALKSSTNYTTSFGQGWGGTGYLPVPGDYDGDGKTDPSVYVAATGQWLILKSSSGYTSSITASWGGTGYTPVPGRDFDGDGKSDITVYLESTGFWYILKSSTNFTTAQNISWGGTGYTLVAGDYDGDGKADPGLYQRSTGNWAILKSSTGYTTTIAASWGGAGYDPVPGDYDGDAKFDIGIVQRSTGNWYVLKSSTNYTTSMSVLGWGASTDTLISSAIVPGGSNDTKRATDFDGDGKSEMTIYNGSTGYWYSLTSASGFTAAVNRSWGGTVYLPVPGDYDGDGRTDYGIYHSISGVWTILLSGAGYTTTLSKSNGGGALLPIVGDFDGDGKSDIGSYNPSTGQWYVLKSSTGYTTTLSVSWGGAGYTAAPGDWDGDGKVDLGIYQQSSGNWYVLLSSSNYTTSLSKSAGGSSYVPVQGDYDGDGKTDFVVYNTTSGQWYGLKSSTGYTTTINVSWGGTGYTPVRGDLDGDGKIDLAIYQASSGNWYVLLSASGYTTSLSKSWGGSGYVPVPAYP